MHFHRPSKIGFRIFLLVAVLCFTIRPGCAAEPFSVALVGEGYGKYEIEAISRRVMTEMEGAVVYELCPSKLPAEEFKRFGLVILASSTAEPYRPEETKEIQQYLLAGGKLLLIGTAPRNLLIEDASVSEDGRRRRAPQFLFGPTQSKENSSPAMVNQSDSPLLSGVFSKTQKPFWLSDGIFLPKADCENIIGVGEEALVLVGRFQVGRGEVYYLGHELFRLVKKAKELDKPEELDGWIQILTNIIKAASQK